MKFLIISTSLNKESKSVALANYAYNLIRAENTAEFLDLRDLNLPLCSGYEVRGTAIARKIYDKVSQADGIFLVSPIYNFDVNAAAKNFFEFAPEAWHKKIVALAATAGTIRSHMSLIPFANSLMLDRKCVIVPEFVVAQEELVSSGEITDFQTQERMNSCVGQLIDFTYRLKGSMVKV